MMWIIVGHRYLVFYYTPHVNANSVRDWKKRTENMIIVSGSFAVDTFFVIGGLLVSYLFFQAKASGVKISVPMLYIHRILR